MVGQSIDDDRDAWRRRLSVGFVLLVGLSGGLIAIQGDATPSIIGLSVGAGLATGGALAWYLAWITR